MVLLGGDYLKTEEAQNGDIVVFEDGGNWIESQRWKNEDGSPKWDFVIKVKWHDVTKSMRLNKTNRDALILAYGNETEGWVDRAAKITKEKVMVAGKKMDTIVLTPCDVEDAPPQTAEGGEIPF